MGNTAISTEIVKITPDMARQWLRTNTRNRTIRKTAVDAYARDMAAGNWVTTHQGIAFDADGTLIDGQHRLLAICKANIPVTMMVTRGFEPKTIDMIDNGSKRSTRDIIKWRTDDECMTNKNVIAAAKYIMRRIMNVVDTAPTDREVYDFMTDNIELMRLMDSYSRSYRKCAYAYMLSLAATLAVAQIPHRHVMAWFDIMNSNIMPGPGTEYNVKAALDFKQAIDRKERWDSKDIIVKAQAAFYMFYENKKRIPSDTKASVRYPITRAGLEGYKKTARQMAFDAAREAAQEVC